MFAPEESQVTGNNGPMFWFNSRGYQVNVLETVIVNLAIQILDTRIPGILGNHIKIFG